jgi:hypothetical protein
MSNNPVVCSSAECSSPAATTSHQVS